MKRDPNKEYTMRVFRELCAKAIGRVPEGAKDETADWETRREWALKQLLHEVQRYVDSTSIVLGVGEIPEWQWLEVQIIHCLFFSWSIQVSRIETVTDAINDFVTDAVGAEPAERT